jgi:hypothetical protein
MLAAVAALLVAFADGAAQPGPRSTARQAWLRSLAIAGLACIAVSYHVKGLFLLPLMLACLVFATRGAKAHLPRIASALLMLAATASAMTYWRDRLSCPGNAVLAHAYNAHNLSDSLAHVSSLGQAKALLGQMLANISIFQYVSNIGPQLHPLSEWLERDQIGSAASSYWLVALDAAWALALIAAAITVAAAVLADLRKRRLDPRVALAVVAFGIAVAWSSTELIRNVYESKFVLLLVILAIVLALSTRSSDRLKLSLNTTASAIGLFALLSPFAIGAIYAPSLARAAGQQGNIEAQPNSVSVFGYSRLKPRIEAAAKLCGIKDPSKARAVMVDDTTYFAFMRSKLPQHQLGVVGLWSGKLKDPIAYLKSRGSDGAVVSCRVLHGAMRARARAAGNFCCIGPPGW